MVLLETKFAREEASRVTGTAVQSAATAPEGREANAPHAHSSGQHAASTTAHVALAELAELHCAGLYTKVTLVQPVGLHLFL